MIYAHAEDEFRAAAARVAVRWCSVRTSCTRWRRQLNKVLFVATGALLSTVSSGQGETIPCIAHAVAVENDLS